MLRNLVAGSALAALTVLIHTVGLIVIGAATPQVARRLGFHAHDVGRTLVMTATVMGILAILTLEVWTWAIAYDLLGVAQTLGQMAFDPAWRQLTALEGINGFLMIGWSTAYLVGAATRHGPFRQGEHF